MSWLVCESTSVSYPTMHQSNITLYHFVTEMTMHTCALFCYRVVHCGIWYWCIVEFLRMVLLWWECSALFDISINFQEVLKRDALWLSLEGKLRSVSKWTWGVISVSHKSLVIRSLEDTEMQDLCSLIVGFLWNLTGILAAVLPRCLSNFKGIP